MIDASNATRRAIEYIKQKKLTLKALFITHRHIDHYDGLDNVLKEYPDLKIYIQKIDLRLLSQHKVDDETGEILGPGINYPLTNIVFNFVEKSWWNKKNHQYDNFKRKLYKLLILLFNFFIR